MAERLRSFDFSVQSTITPATKKGRNRYPWSEWFDGDIWKITHGEDFWTAPLMMERIIRTRASNKNHRARVMLRHIPTANGDQPSIVLQRTDVVGPSASKKEEQKQKRLAKKAAAEQAAAATLEKAGIKPVKKAVSKRPAKAPARA